MRNLNVDQVSISRVGPSEVDHLFEILDQATQWLSSQGMNHWNGVHTKERLLAEFEASHVLLARTEELGPIGTVTISFATPFYHQPSDRDFWSDPNADAAYVRKLAVLPEYVKRGSSFFERVLVSGVTLKEKNV